MGAVATGAIATGTIAAAAFAAALLTAQPTQAGKADDTLRVAWGLQLDNPDIYFNTLREGIVFARLVWDNLVERDPATFQHKPGLATAWRQVDPTTLEFDIRQGVKFHNGDPLDADDVVYTVNWVADPANKILYQQNVSWVQRAEKVDPYKVRIIMKQPFPIALEHLAGTIFIYPRKYHQQVGPAGMAKAPVGSGPYKVDRIDGPRFEMSRFEGHYDGSPKGKPRISKLSIRTLPDVATQVAELMGGGVDLLWYLPADQTDRLEKVANLAVARGESMRVGFLILDAAGRTGAGNPMTSLKVRQAVAHAIDREAIVTNLVRGQARVIHAPCFPAQFGCDDSTATRYPYDVAKAKALLAEAGLPNGFQSELVWFRDRARSEAVAGYLNAVGIRTTLTSLQNAAANKRYQEGGIPLYYNDWGSYSIPDAAFIINNFFRGSPDDGARDADVKAILDKTDAAIDPAERKALFRQAIERITAAAYWVPLHTFVTNFAFSKDLDFQAFADDIPRYYLYGWK
jgi:peptide/nickel transport system substrate-binding protein